MTIGSLAFCLALYLTGIHFRGKLQHVGHVGEQNIKCRPVRNRWYQIARRTPVFPLGTIFKNKSQNIP